MCATLKIDGRTWSEAAVKRALIEELSNSVSHVAESIRWGSWTLAADLAEEIAKRCREIRRQEMTPVERQEMLDLLVKPAEGLLPFEDFRADASHRLSGETSVSEAQASSRTASFSGGAS